MRPVGVSSIRIRVCVAGFDMYKVAADSWRSEIEDEEWLELVGQLLLIIRLRLVTQTDSTDQLFEVMDRTSNFQQLKFDPSEQTTTRVKT